MKKHLSKTFIFIILILWLHTGVATPDNICTNAQSLQKTFPSGAQWDMCWSIRPNQGLVLSQIYYKPPGQERRKVLGEISLSQLETVFDDNIGKPSFLVTTGKMGNHILSLHPQDCKGGQLKKFKNINALCSISYDYGYLYRRSYTNSRRGNLLELRSAFQPDRRTYTLRWHFYENGAIEPALGLSGILPKVGKSTSDFGWPITKNGTIASSFTDNAIWRLDFDLGDDSSNDVVEEIASKPTEDRLQKIKTISLLPRETARRLNPENKLWWRVRDGSTANESGNFISYEIVPSDYNSSRSNIRNEGWLQNDLYFTQFHECENFPVQNPHKNCKSNLKQFLNNETIDQQDIVVWYKQSYHHIPRSENGTYINTIWNSFQLLPRDWNAQNPL